jgi:hypothetical protein
MSGQATLLDSSNATVAETKADFARRMGWNKSTATRYAQQGKLVLTASGLVDVDASIARLKSMRDPTKDAVREVHAHARVDRELRADSDSVRIDPNDPSFASIQQSRALTEATKAKLLQIELDEKEGRLVNAEAIQRAVYAAIRGIRDRTFQISARVAPILAAETDAFKVDQLLEAEIRSVFEDAARELSEKGVMVNAR